MRVAGMVGWCSRRLDLPVSRTSPAERYGSAGEHPWCARRYPYDAPDILPRKPRSGHVGCPDNCDVDHRDRPELCSWWADAADRHDRWATVDTGEHLRPHQRRERARELRLAILG